MSKYVSPSLSQMILNCFILGDTRGFPVVLGEKITIKNDTIPFEIFNVGLLIDYIYEKKKDIISSSNIDVWKVEIEETDENREKLKNTEINIGREFGGKRLSTTKLTRKIFSDGPPDERIHILVQPPPSPANTGLKRTNSDQNMRARKLVRTYGPVDVSENFYVPFRELDSTRNLEDVINQNLCALLVGHFQSGKTSVLHYLRDTKANYFYVHSSVLTCGFLLGLSDSLSLKQCTSCDSLCKEIKDKYKEKIVILIDEFDRFLFNSKKNKNIEHAIDEIRELTKLISDRSIGIKSIVYTGTYSIVAMLKESVPQIRKVIETPSQESIDSLSEDESLSHDSKCLLEPQPIPSPLNSAKAIQASDFTKDQHMLFFNDIQKDRHIKLSEEVLDDIYSITNGYAGLEGLLASLCMEYSANEKTLEFDKWNERFTEFRRSPTNYQIKAVNHIEKHLSGSSDNGLLESARNLLGRFLRRGTLRSSEIKDSDTNAIMHLQAIGIIKDLGSELFGFTSNIMLDLLSTKYYPLYREGLATIPDIKEPQQFLKDILGLLKFIHHDVIFHSLAANLHSFSEAIIQGELYALLRSAVSNNTYKVFRETRTLKGSEKKCDLWVCNGKEYGIECMVNGDSKDEISNAVKQAVGYTKGRKNACSMFVLNFMPSDSIANNYGFFFPSVIYPEGLYFEMVHILYSKADRSAQIFRRCAETEKISFAAER
ncbi:hypothetical protein GLOIN_2v1785738 [Rhizophagus irregularis DAOM 181602=DAOM 197198]|uniref:Uncharacterized protein n=3 Tax=Rhizophagus irregularis TaxID=588596 RepID=A0A2P4P9R9_RHIID|nr:hypothetical protein GLOIN_2v1785738 [Rhizophagus irregularis DAOM 181602=DAOM 197198]POG62128.1 hypothetical protein GLOIN_2v1785738 [Rhizophagus irregularis DAOM 181602=DAOM 197198]|eukprot:XP_025168994.1 hypothetical protein GLOIN_2v1785738 [Rhizophagus irregularis DAOM 181602=DAOM 197198]